jgi:hypothetical protein
LRNDALRSTFQVASSTATMRMSWLLAGSTALYQA